MTVKIKRVKNLRRPTVVATTNPRTTTATALNCRYLPARGSHYPPPAISPRSPTGSSLCSALISKPIR